ncbi:MAG: KH domain-containing protein [Bacilli bacterium]|nr:KH domain-containing protein [Bacilli bacterium]MDD4607554.1 KH domain-containing protein [Bacilli bacterium]
MKVLKYEGKTKEDAISKCLTELNKELSDLYIIDKEQEGGLFKGKKIIIEVLLKEEVINYIKSFIRDLGTLMGIQLNSEVREVEDIIQVILVTDQTAIIIGKDGRTLEAIQLLLRQSISSVTNFNVKVNVDSSNYRRNKERNFEYEIKKIVKEVLKSKIEVKLDPMNSYKRRIVHTIVSNYNDLETVSVGEAPERYVIIKYKED